MRPAPTSAPVPSSFLLRQRDHARQNGQTDRAELFEDLVDRAIEASA